jgi:hypothetical protein
VGNSKRDGFEHKKRNDNMTEDKGQIQKLIKEGLSIIDEMGNFYPNTRVGKNAIRLIETIKKLYPIIQDSNPVISDVLLSASTKLNNRGTINAFRYGDVRTSLKILKDRYCLPPKIFISHKSEDEAFVKALVKLLRLYIGSEAEKIFCSSVPTYKIGIGKEIFPEIESQFEGNDIFMIIVHSPRYYQSSVCLNEMGAAWIQDTECYSFLTADCEYDDLDGVIDNKFISIKVNAKDATDRMNEFMGEVLDFFNMPKPDFSTLSQWETDRDEFLKEVCILDLVEEQGKKAKDGENPILDSLSDFDKEHLKKWADCDDGECWIIETMDGSFIQIGEEEFCVNTGRERAEWDNFFERLMELGFAAIDRPNSDGSPIYKLKKPAYDYVESLKT